MAEPTDFITPEEAFRVALEFTAEAYRTGPSSDAVKSAEFALHCTYRLVTYSHKGKDRF